MFICGEMLRKVGTHMYLSAAVLEKHQCVHKPINQTENSPRK